MTRKHRAVFISNQSNTKGFIDNLLNGALPGGFEDLQGKQGALFSKLALDQFIEEEVRHDRKLLTPDTSQSLQSMSSGERKKALLGYLLKLKPDFLILDNPFDNLDKQSREYLENSLQKISRETAMVQLIGRKHDLLPFINNYYLLEGNKVILCESLDVIGTRDTSPEFKNSIPKPLTEMNYDGKFLVQFKNVSVVYGDTPILCRINWDIRPDEFWQLKGKNGSGKTTLLSMITGDNPKGYGQELFLFGTKKGSGESIWDIKKKIGYFTPAMIDRFTGYHTLQNMLISGLTDSIGLYLKPTEIQIRLANEWLNPIDMSDLKETYFHDLSMGQQRLVMCARAMIKHPLLLILDEPTAGLDDRSAALFISLVNKLALESKTAIVFVSHREEPGLRADFEFELLKGKKGSIGRHQ